MVETPILNLYLDDLKFPEPVLNKYIRDPQEARDAICKGGIPLLSEVIIKNWACHYFSRDMEVNSSSNQFGFDIKSVDGEIFLEVKTCWKPSTVYAAFKSIKQKKDKEGEYAFTHIAFYSPLIDPDGVVLFTRKKFNKLVTIPPAGKLNIKIDLNEGYQYGTCHESSKAFYNNIKSLCN